MTARPDLEKLGSGYGGWIVPEDLIASGWICYCAGVGEDVTFDLELAQRGCEVLSLDPTPAAVSFVAGLPLPSNIRFLPVGLWNDDTEMKFFAPREETHISHSVKNLQQTTTYFVAPCRSVASLMEELSHDHVDLLKVDIEGAEYEVLEDLIDHGALPTVICVEFDQPMPLRRMIRLTRELLRSHSLVSIDGWNYCFVARGMAGRSDPIRDAGS